MTRDLVDIAKAEYGDTQDPSAKPIETYRIYARYFDLLAEQPVKLLELGVHSGKSLKILASYFAKGTIIGVDLGKTSPDFPGYPNISYVAGDQTDTGLLNRVHRQHAPDGFDIVIDDASHVGRSTAISYATLFPHLKSGGLYVIEDWGTGYYGDWPDGHPYQKTGSGAVGGAGKRFPGHDYGMVGFVKSLVDEVAGDHIRPSLFAAASRVDTVEFLHVYKTFAILKKH